MAKPSDTTEKKLGVGDQSALANSHISGLVILNEITKEDLMPSDEEKKLIEELYDWEKQSERVMYRI